VSFLTYPRSDGFALLPGTLAAVRAMAHIPPSEILDPVARYDYLMADAKLRAEFDALAAQAATTPPEFLRFALVRLEPGEEPPFCPGECPASEGMPPGGSLMEGVEETVVAQSLGISLGALKRELLKFSGTVMLHELKPGTRIYRTVGLMVTAAQYGGVVNKVLGDYWEPICPRAHGSLAVWRAKTAVLPQWNGDFGYIEVVLTRQVQALVGRAGMQSVGGKGDRVLPGGGEQLYLPSLTAADVGWAEGIPPLAQLIEASCFDQEAP